MRVELQASLDVSDVAQEQFDVVIGDTVSLRVGAGVVRRVRVARDGVAEVFHGKLLQAVSDATTPELV